MYQLSRFIKIGVIIILGVIIYAVPLAGQSLWLKYNHKPSFSIETYKIKYEPISWYYESDTKLLNMTNYFSAYIPASPDLSVVFELPIANLSAKEIGAGEEVRDYEQTSIGNPYIGLEYENPERTFTSTFGIRFPLASEEKKSALLQSAVTNPDRVEAFAIKRLSLYASGSYNYLSPDGFTLRTGLGPLVFIPTEEGPDPEFYVRYFTQIWTETGNMTMAAGLTGFYWVTEEDLDFGERTQHHINLAGFYQIGIFRPGLFFSAPLDFDFSYTKDYTYGFSLTFEFEGSYY